METDRNTWVYFARELAVLLATLATMVWAFTTGHDALAVILAIIFVLELVW